MFPPFCIISFLPVKDNTHSETEIVLAVGTKDTQTSRFSMAFIDR